MAKLFNILVNAVVWKWMRLVHATIDDTDSNLAKRIVGLFAVLYLDDGYIASCNAKFLKEAFDILVETFKCIGLATKTKKTQAMVCTPGKIQVQLLLDSYKRMRKGVAAGEELQRAVVCHVCNKSLQARSLRPHLLSTHDIPQQAVVANALLRSGKVSTTEPTQGDGRTPYSACSLVARACSSVHMLRIHFRDLHPNETVEILREGNFPQCKCCMMQCNPRYLLHIPTQVCLLGVEQRTQQDWAILAALALRKEGEVLEKVDLFWYLGQILAQDYDDVWAVRQQIKKAQGIWARVRQVLMADKTPPKVSAKFYKAVIQSVLLYGSET